MVVNKSLHSSYIQTECNDKILMIIIIFSAYFVPLLKHINNPVLLQEWKLNLGDSAYEKNIDANMSKPSDKKEIDHHDSNSYWRTSLKDTIQGFTFLAITEHTANIVNPNKGLISSLLNGFCHVWVSFNW